MLPRSLYLLFSLAATVSAIDVFVSTKGSDSPSGGTQTRPYSGEAINVLIEGGVYELTSPLSFTPADSGSVGAPVTYASQPGTGPVTISGGVEVDPTSWVQSKSNPSLWSCKLPADTVYFRQLWVNSNRYVMAQSPLMKYKSTDKWILRYEDGQLPTTTPHNPADALLGMYESWEASYHEISSIDKVTLAIGLKNPYKNTTVPHASGNRFYLVNWLEELDQPGEFYFDRASNVLSVIFEDGINPKTASVIYPQANVTFSYTMANTVVCFSSECASQSADGLGPGTINIEEAVGWTIDSVTVSHTGGYCVYVGQGSTNNTLDGLYLFDFGAGGVQIGPDLHGPYANATAGNYGSTVQNCLIEGGGQFFREGAGVLAQAVVGVRIQHNTIRNMFYSGISLGWSWGYIPTAMRDNYIGFNDIYNIGQGQLSDMGCIYTLGSQPGTVVTNNLCHNVTSYDYGGWGLYTDEGSRFITFSNNIVYNTKCAGLHQNYGLDNLFVNNVFADVNLQACDGAIVSSLAHGNCTYPAVGQEQTCSFFTFEKNIVYAPGNRSLNGIPAAFDNMTLSHNDYWTTSPGGVLQFPHYTNFTQWQAFGKDAGSIVADPDFVSPATNNFSVLASTSPALPLGFVPIDISQIGPLRPSGAPTQSMIVTPSKLPPRALRYTA